MLYLSFLLGWSQQPANQGSVISMNAHEGLHSLPPGPPVQDVDRERPAVSYLFERQQERNKPYPQVYPVDSTQSVYHEHSQNSGPTWYTDEGSETYTLSRVPQPSTDGTLLPSPSYVGGDLENYMANFEHGNSEMETEELRPMRPPPPPPGLYPEPVLQAGELSNYMSIYEHGNNKRETEEEGSPTPYYSVAYRAEELPPAPLSGGFMYPVPIGLEPKLYYLFMTGQLPPGTLSHFQSNYESGNDRSGEVHYKRYYYPVTEVQTTPTENLELPSDEMVQRPTDYRKTR